MRYQRVLLKLSGEALMEQGTHGIDPAVIQRLAEEIHAVVARGTQVGIVVGGGNLLRGAGLASRGMNRVTGDHMGMLATAMNALALQDAIGKAGTDCRVMSALAIAQVCEPYSSRAAIRHLEKGRVVVFAGSIPRANEIQRAKDSGAKVACFAPTEQLALKLIKME